MIEHRTYTIRHRPRPGSGGLNHMRGTTMNAMTDGQVREALAPGEPGDDTVMQLVAALRAAGHEVAVEAAGGLGPRTAYVVAQVDGRRMRISAQPW